MAAKTRFYIAVQKKLDDLLCTAYIPITGTGTVRKTPTGMEIRMFKSVEEVQAMSKDGLEAYMASAVAMTKGFQNMAQESADFSRKSFEKGTQTLEKVISAGSVEKAFEVQQGYFKEAYETLLSQVSKFNELYTTTIREAYRPFEAQVSQFTSKVTAK